MFGVFCPEFKDETHALFSRARPEVKKKDAATAAPLNML